MYEWSQCERWVTMHDGYVTMHDILSEALPVVPAKTYSKPEYVDMTKILSDSGSQSTNRPVM